MSDVVSVSRCHNAVLRGETEGDVTIWYCSECGERCGFFIDGGTLDLEALRDAPTLTSTSDFEIFP